jgi:hypothetical protein
VAPQPTQPTQQPQPTKVSFFVKVFMALPVCVTAGGCPVLDMVTVCRSDGSSGGGQGCSPIAGAECRLLRITPRGTTVVDVRESDAAGRVGFSVLPSEGEYRVECRYDGQTVVTSLGGSAPTQTPAATPSVRPPSPTASPTPSRTPTPSPST